MARGDKREAHESDYECCRHAPGRERCARGDSEQERQSEAAADGSYNEGSGSDQPARCVRWGCGLSGGLLMLRPRSRRVLRRWW